MKTIDRTSYPAFALIMLALLALLPPVHAVMPPPDGGYPGSNTAEGQDALFSLTTGLYNTANGYQALYSSTTALSNTATGGSALRNNTIGSYNTATGVDALNDNTTGGANTATGVAALSSNTTAANNTADGLWALFSNTIGDNNTATGAYALYGNTTANDNTATGYQALYGNTTGTRNTANGFNALLHSTMGNNNTATGYNALLNNTGNNNIAIGNNAGINLTTGSNNIDIGAFGTAGESNTIRIGKGGLQTDAYIQGIRGKTVASGITVIVGTDGHLGTVVSSARFKDEIKPMDKVSETILALKPVTFRYKKSLDPEGIPQFGLVAEQVAKVDPDLVARDDKGEIYTVRYDAVNAMLLNEFLKEHREVAELKSTVVEQRKGMEAMAAQLKEQAAQIQKVSAQLELSKPAPQTARNTD